MSPEEAEEKGWLEVELDDERDCEICGEPTHEGYLHPKANPMLGDAEFVCPSCLEESL